MNLKFLFAAALAGMTATAVYAGDYHVSAPLSEDEDGAMAYIVNYDNGEKVDSVLVTDGKAEFSVSIVNPIAARLIIDGQRAGTFFLEPGEIIVDPKARTIGGSPLNDKYTALMTTLSGIAGRFREIQGDTPEAEASRKAVLDEYNKALAAATDENLDNPLGYMLFIDQAYSMPLAELTQALEEHPTLKQYKRVQNLVTAATNKEETSVGHQFKDFEVKQPDGTVKRLSDYVGKGKYTLVDFWASWCGPCIRETAVLKDILNEYGPQGLEVLGVAVWDKLDDTLGAIEKHGLPWPQILDAQTIPTDLYGISAIPCIILFDPQGKILSRDKQDDDLRADVKAALNGELK